MSFPFMLLVFVLHGQFPYFLSAVMCVLMNLAIAQSRMGLGAHSFDQILLGTIIGISLSCIYIIVGREFMHDKLLLSQFLKKSNLLIVAEFLFALVTIGFSLISYFFIARDIDD